MGSLITPHCIITWTSFRVPASHSVSIAGDVFVVHKPPGWNVSVSFDELDQKKAAIQTFRTSEEHGQ